MPSPDDTILFPNTPDSLDGLIAAYLQAVEAGQAPDRRELIARHPQLADALRAFFADLDLMDRAAAPLRPVQPAVRPVPAVDERLAVPNRIRYIGDYELLDEIDRGGMGIVYRAQQLSLDRIVAVKVVLAGSLASERDVQRFQVEAEAAANLDHPNIVPIYEVGMHAEQKYYSMKLIEGTTLAGMEREDARSEVSRLVLVSRAVQAAHQSGVIHRDLKPSNILVDWLGTPFVSDFGLAKRTNAGDKSLTGTRHAIGTPNYMSPEQAMGRKGITTATDVYSLGVILFERVTGRRPFVEEDEIALLQAVCHALPPRPSTISGKVDGDLETIILKCLEKDPARRYGSAEALADDLDHWLKGEPISAKPVGQVERAWLWCRRNPAVAGLTTAVAVSLLGGIIVASYFAREADKRAGSEHAAKLAAEKSEGDAVVARDQTDKALVRGLIAPLDAHPQDAATLSEVECEALWQVALLESDRLRLRYVDELTRDPSLVHKLGSRSEPAMIGAVGLDLNLKAAAEKLLLSRMRDGSLPFHHRMELAYTAIEFAEGPGDLADTCLATIKQALAASRVERVFGPFTHDFRLNVGWEPRVAAAVFTTELNDGSNDATGARSILDIVRLLTDVAKRTAPSDSAQVWPLTARAQVDAIEHNIDLQNLPELPEALAAITSRMDDRDTTTAYSACARKCVSEIVGGMREHKQLDHRWGKALLSIGVKMDQTERGALYREMVAALESATDGYQSVDTGDYLLTVLNSMTAGERPRIAGDLLADLSKRLSRETDESRKSQLTGALRVVTGRQRPVAFADDAHCRETAQRFLEVFDQQPSASIMEGVVSTLAALAEHLEPGQKTRLYATVTPRLAEVAGNLSTDELVSSIDTLLGFTEHLEPSVKTKLYAKMASALLVSLREVPENYLTGYERSAQFGAVAKHLDVSDANRLCVRESELLQDALHADNAPTNIWTLNDSLSRIAEYADATTKSRLWSEAARSLLERWRTERDLESRSILGGCFCSIARHVEPVEATPLWIGVVRTVHEWSRDPKRAPNSRNKSRVPFADYTLLECAAEALADRPDARLEAVMLIRLIAQMQHSNWSYTQPIVARAAPLARQLDRADAERLLDELLQFDGSRLSEQKDLVLALASRLAPNEEAAACGKAVRILSQASKLEDWAGLADAMVILSRRMEPAEAWRALSEIPRLCANAAAPVLMLRKIIDLAETLSGDQAVTWHRAVVRILIDRQMSPEQQRVAEHVNLECWGEEIVPLLESFDAETARRVVVVLAHSATAGRDVNTIGEHKYNVALLDALISGEERKQGNGAAKRFGAPSTDESLAPPDGSETPTTALKSCRLTTPQLVELLKMPTCYGAARRVVLEHLGNRYGRRFNTHWEFVRFAEAEKLGLDFKTPPRRPDPAKLLEELKAALGENQTSGETSAHR